MPATPNTVWYANYGNGSSTGYYAVTQWATGTAKTAGQIVRQLATPTVGNERCFICIVAGTTHASTEPTWTITKGGKTTDNTVTWQECTGQPAVNGDVTSTPPSSGQRSQTPLVGLIIKNNAADHYFILSTAGSCGAGEPSYNTTTGATTVDSAATWTCIGAVSSFTTTWGAPFARTQAGGGAFSNSFAAQGDTIYVSAAHAETVSAFAGYQSFPGSSNGPPYTNLVCVSNTPSLPPVAADLTTGAQALTTGTGVGMQLQGGNAYIRGMTYSIGTGASGQSLALSFQTLESIMENCSLILGGTGGGLLQIGNSGKTVLINTTLTFNGSASNIRIIDGHFIWRDTPNAVVKASGSWPTTLFSLFTQSGVDGLIENVDLSAFAGTALFVGTNAGCGHIVFSHCKLPAISPLVTNASMVGPQSTIVDFINCDSGGATYRHERWCYEGSQIVDTSALRTGGAGDGTTSYSWKMVTTAGSSWIQPYEALPISIWNTLTGANRTVTIEGAYNGAALPNNDDIWLEVVYFGTAGSTQGTRVSETKATFLSANAALGTSAALWGGSAPARQNGHAYALGDLIGVSSASSIVRLFVCTSAGTSNGSLPGGYASAVDGGVVTDSGATFRAVERFQLTVTLNSPQPQLPGHFVCYVRAAKASSTFWIDPYVTLT